MFVYNIDSVRGVLPEHRATAHDDPSIGITHLLIMNEGLYYGTAE